MGLWSRSSSAVVDVFGYGPAGSFIAFNCHSDDGYGNADARWVCGFAPAFCVGTMTGVYQSDIIALPS